MAQDRVDVDTRAFGQRILVEPTHPRVAMMDEQLHLNAFNPCASSMHQTR